MKIAIVTDTHFGAREGSREILKHQLKFYDEIFFPELLRRGVTRIFHLGDIVDKRKNISFFILNALRREFINKAKDLGMTLDILVGNHDIFFRHSNEVNAISETFSESTHIRVYSEPTEIELDGTRILMLPWIHDNNSEESLNAIQNSRASICFGHLELAGFEMHSGVASHGGHSSSLFSRFELVASGHYHKKSSSGNVNYLGSPYEMTWNDYNCPRGFHFFDTQTRELEYVRNPHKLFHKITYDEGDLTAEKILKADYSQFSDCYVKVIALNRKNEFLFNMFMTQLMRVKPIDVSVLEDFALTQGESVSNEEVFDGDTLSLLSKYVDGITWDGDKPKLNALLADLYTTSYNGE